MALIEAVCVVHAVRPDEGDVGETAIDKRPAVGRVAVRVLGLHGDKQMDTEHHGGREKAVYAFAGEDASWWASVLDREVEPGVFGENLRTTGLDVTGAVIGEQWLIGGDDHDDLPFTGTVLEVTQPRVPCAPFQRWMREPHWIQRFTDHGTPGAYLRVVREGSVGAGDRVRVRHRPAHGVTIGECFAAFAPDVGRRLIDAAADGQIELASSLRRHCEQALARA
jgi:MOSC domain-containing protein YiiM